MKLELKARELKRAMTGLPVRTYGENMPLKYALLRVRDGYVIIESSDGFRLVRYVCTPEKCDDGFPDVLLNPKTLKKHLKVRERNAVIDVDLHNVRQGRVIVPDGLAPKAINPHNYPNTARLYPGESYPGKWSHEWTVYCDDLLLMASGAAWVVRSAGVGGGILSYDNEDRIITYRVIQKEETGRSKVFMFYDASTIALPDEDGEVHEDEAMIGVNPDYLIDALRMFTSERVIISMNDRSDPLMLRAGGNQDHSVLIMPVFLTAKDFDEAAQA